MHYGDQTSFPVYAPDPSLLAARAAAFAASQTPLVEHYDASKERRTKGAGFYAFSGDEEARREELEALRREREETERKRGGEKGKVEGEREREKEERKRLVLEKRRALEGKRKTKEEGGQEGEEGGARKLVRREES